jgi:hypothetical protein
MIFIDDLRSHYLNLIKIFNIAYSNFVEFIIYTYTLLSLYLELNANVILMFINHRNEFNNIVKVG